MFYGLLRNGVDPVSVLEGLNVAQRRPAKVEVPSFVGLRCSERAWVAAGAGVKTKTVSITENPEPTDGLIVAQEPAAGTTVKRGTVVVLYVEHPAAIQIRQVFEPLPEPVEAGS